MAIIVTQNGKYAKKIERTTFQHEDELQKYIFNNPESLPLYEIEEDIKLLIISREFPTESGPIDALGIDANGDIYIIETKLYKNPDKRLVVAQVLDYGASLWNYYRDFGEFLNLIEIQINQKFNTSFNQKLQEFFEINDLSEIQIILDNFKKNLQDGKFRFVVLMDTLEKRLKDLIAFIDQNSQFDIYGVEMEYYKLENMEVTIPKLFGAEIKKDVGFSSKISARKKWDEISFFEAAKNNLNEAELKTLRKLYDFSKQKDAEITWGTGATRGSFNPRFQTIGSRSLFTVFTDGYININFGWMNDNERTIQLRDEFKKNLEQTFAFKFPTNVDDKFPNFSKEQLLSHVDKFIKVIEDLLK